MSIFKRIFLLSSLALLIAGPSLALAADTAVTLKYAPPCVGTTCQPIDLTSTTVLQQYLVRLYWFAVGISGIVAVLMIVYGGLLYTTSELIGKKQEGKGHIQNALVGMALLFGAYFILNQVNPNIVNLTSGFKDFNTLPAAPTSTPKDMGACASSTEIRGTDATPIAQGATPDPGNSCKYRKLFVPSNFVIDPSGDYYFDLLNTQVGASGVIWVYPYFQTKNGTSTARCIVYAYRKSGEKGASFIGLKDSIEPCFGAHQEPGTTMTAADAGKPIDDCPPIIKDENGGQIGGGCEPPPTNIQQLAKNLLQGGVLNFNEPSSCQPSNSSVSGILTDLSKGVSPQICHCGCSGQSTTCTDTRACGQKNGVWPSEKLLTALRTLQQNGVGAKVNSLTGGDHRNNSTHYSGTGVDLGVSQNTKSSWNWLIQKATEAGLAAHCEYNQNGTTKYLPAGQPCPDEIFNASGSPQGISNLHIHADA